MTEDYLISTPRTDAKVNYADRFSPLAQVVPYDFARKLEREIVKLRDEIAAARQSLDPEGELSSLSVAEIAALRSIKS